MITYTELSKMHSQKAKKALHTMTFASVTEPVYLSGCLYLPQSGSCDSRSGVSYGLGLAAFHHQSIIDDLLKKDV